MIPITVAVPDEKADFFKQLIEILHFKEVDFAHSETEIPLQHQKLVLERISTSKPEDFINWQEAKNKLKLDNGF